MSHGLAAGHASGKSVMKWEGEKGREWIWYMWHIKMEMRLRRVHHINSLIGPVKAMDATLLRPHRMTSLMGWRPALPYNQTVQSPTSQTPVWGSAECFLFSSSIPALTLSPPLPDLYLISTDQIIFYSTFSDRWVCPSGSWPFSACCQVYEAPPSRTWQLPLPPWAQPAFWFGGPGTLLKKRTEEHGKGTVFDHVNLLKVWLLFYVVPKWKYYLLSYLWAPPEILPPSSESLLPPPRPSGSQLCVLLLSLFAETLQTAPDRCKQKSQMERTTTFKLRDRVQFFYTTDQNKVYAVLLKGRNENGMETKWRIWCKKNVFHFMDYLFLLYLRLSSWARVD